jgi:RNA polymerase sigma-70 factor (ECF subfamily)
MTQRNDIPSGNPEKSADGANRAGYRLRIDRERSNDLDLVLLAEIARKNEDALIRLYDKYRRSVYSMLLRIVKIDSEAEELLQDVFMQVWEKAELFDAERGYFDTWLFTLTHNKAINTLRSRLYKKNAQEDRKDIQDLAAVVSPQTTQETTPLSEQEDADDRKAVLHALDKIPGEQRDALMLAYYEGLSQSEIAGKLGVPLGTIKTRMRQGMIKLQGLLGELRKQ